MSSSSPYSPQILYAYETLGLTPAEIAEQFADGGVTYPDVIKILGDQSPKYRAELEVRGEKVLGGPNPSRDISEEEELLQEYRILSKSASNELVKERSLKFLINEAKGRNDLGKRGLDIKERQLGLQAVNTAARVQEFANAIQSINDRLTKALIGPSNSIPYPQKEITI